LIGVAVVEEEEGVDEMPSPGDYTITVMNCE
jgi:hypothetical protein